MESKGETKRKQENESRKIREKKRTRKKEIREVATGENFLTGRKSLREKKMTNDFIITLHTKRSGPEGEREGADRGEGEDEEEEEEAGRRER